MQKFLHDCLVPDVSKLVSYAPLSTEWLRDAIYIPKVVGKTFDDDPDYGLYKADGTLCQIGAYRRGVRRALVGQSDRASIEASSINEAPDHIYVYAGPFYTHFGHFLVSTLPRLWPRLNGQQNIKLLVHGEQDPQEWFKLPFVNDVLTTLSLTANDFVHFDRPCRIRNILVPEPAFTELGEANSALDEFCGQVGSALSRPSLKPSALVYLSKSQVETGVWRFNNEKMLEDVLRTEGVHIVHPQQFSVPHQLEVLESASLILGTLCSALHLALLTKNGLRWLLCLPVRRSLKTI